MVRDYTDAWNFRDVDAIATFFVNGGESVDVTTVGNDWATPWKCHETIRQALREMFAGIPDLAFELRSLQARDGTADHHPSWVSAAVGIS